MHTLTATHAETHVLPPTSAGESTLVQPSLAARLKSFWREVYVKPNAAEKGWGVFSLLRGTMLATVSWIWVLGPLALIAVVAMDALRGYMVVKYIQTIRNIFTYHRHANPLIDFAIYYLKRFAFQVFLGFLLLLAAFQCEAFTGALLLHLVWSRFTNSSHFFVGNIEAKMVKSGLMARDKLAHIQGTIAVVGTVAAQMDLAGVSLLGWRPCVINLAISAGLLAYYLVVYVRSKRDARALR